MKKLRVQERTVRRPVARVTIDSEDCGQRLDNFLFKVLKDVPRSHIYRLLRRGEVRVNGARRKADYRLRTGDQVRLPPVFTGPEKISRDPPIRLRQVISDAILHEDRDLLVLNKPSGMAVHGGSGLSWGVIELVRKFFANAAGYELAHRLDRDTSGCLMIAKKRSVLRRLQEALREGSLRKEYRGVAAGNWPADLRSVSAPLQRQVLRGGERIVVTAPEGKPALTKFQLLDDAGGCSFLRIRPVTGRTHQIRVHAALSGHPLLGDEKYGRKEANANLKTQLGDAYGLMLHAERLVIPGLSEQPLRVCAPEPERFRRLAWELSCQSAGQSGPGDQSPP